MAEIEFNISHIDNYAIIEEPCTVIVKVASSIDVTNLYSLDGHPRWILPLKAITSGNLSIIKKVTKAAHTVNYSDVGHLLMSGALWESQINKDEEFPTKGERVIVTFDYVDEVLRCVGITLIPRKPPKLFLSDSYIVENIKEFENLIKEIEDEKDIYT